MYGREYIESNLRFREKRHNCNFFSYVRWDFGYCGHYWPIVPAPGDTDGDCGEIGGMKIGKGTEVL
jgi:hypothetical protein